MNQEKCPQCHGFGKILTFHGKVADIRGHELTCDMCGGKGRLPANVARYRAYGAYLRAERIKRRMTLRCAAATFGMDPSNLSKMERGLIAPQRLY